ncbi:glycosyltransferase family 2 protein [Trichothermofontia sp.]
MPVYNAERYVAQAVTSILNQTFSDFEFLIIDDGSTDRSLDILKEWAVKDPRIQLESCPNQGVARTRNRLLQRARGEFIAVMDADDISLPDRFALQVSFLQQHPEVVCVGGCHDLIDKSGRFLTSFKLPQTDAEIQIAALAGHGSICHPCAMIRRAALIEIGGYDERYQSAHDLDIWLKLGELGQLANLEASILKYRIHTNSVSAKSPIEQRLEAKLACEQAWKRRGITGHFEATEPWRPGPDRASQHHFMLKYGWWAFNSRQRQTAIIYGLKAIQKLPWAIAGWKLLLVALIKPLPPAE